MATDSGRVPNTRGILATPRSGEPPAGGIPLTASQAYIAQCKQLRLWLKRSEYWPIVYGPFAATVGVTLSSFVISTRARQHFHLFQRHFWPTIGAVMIFSSGAYFIINDQLVLRPLLLREVKCNICLEVRSMLNQAGCGVALPFGLSYIACSVAALAERTYPVAQLSEPRKLVSSLRLFASSYRRTIPLLILAHVVAASGLTYLSLRTNDRLAQRQQSFVLADN